MKTDARAIFDAAVRAADPYRNTYKAIRKGIFGRVRLVLAIGKAAVPMLDAAVDACGAENIAEAILVTKYGHAQGLRAKNCTVFEAGHPISDENSLRAAEYVLAQIKGLCAEDIVLVLLSGGGSALFEKPLVAPGLQRTITDTMMKNGADIFELNTVRRRLSAVKGGKLAAAMQPAAVYTYALSDVPGNAPAVVASGLTVQEPVPEEAFWRIVNKYRLNENGELAQLPVLPEATSKRFLFVGDMTVLRDGAAQEAKKRGYKVRKVGELTGDATNMALDAVQYACVWAAGSTEKTALLWWGETTVTVKGNGKGGRSQQAALEAAIALQGREDIVFLAGGSDGTDGPTDAAGGIVDGTSFAKMTAAGTDPLQEAANNNAYAALGAADALLMTGPTGTNVNDLFIIVINRDKAE